MAATTRSSPASNGAHGVAVKAKDAGDSSPPPPAARPCRRSPPALRPPGSPAAFCSGRGSDAAPRCSVAAHPALALADGLRHAASAAGKASRTIDEIRAVASSSTPSNRRSPIEVLLDGLTHRRGAHRREG